MRMIMDAKKVAVIGECMVELQKQGDLYKQAFGGDTLNTAVYLSRLTKDHGISTSYFTGLGKDPFSEQMISEWNKEGINTEYTYLSDTKLPGLYAISTTPDGERSFQYWRSDAAARFFLRDIPCYFWLSFPRESFFFPGSLYSLLFLVSFPLGVHIPCSFLCFFSMESKFLFFWFLFLKESIFLVLFGFFLPGSPYSLLFLVSFRQGVHIPRSFRFLFARGSIFLVLFGSPIPLLCTPLSYNVFSSYNSQCQR